MRPVVSALQQELTLLEAELKADPRYRKATRIRELLGDYVDEAIEALPPRREPGRRPSKKALIKKEIEQLLLSDGPTHRKKILESLQSKGLMGHEKDPMASLAAYLSAFSDNLANDGSGIWSIVEPARPRTRKPPSEQAA